MSALDNMSDEQLIEEYGKAEEGLRYHSHEEQKAERNEDSEAAANWRESGADLAHWWDELRFALGQRGYTYDTTENVWKVRQKADGTFAEAPKFKRGDFVYVVEVDHPVIVKMALWSRDEWVYELSFPRGYFLEKELRLYNED